MSFATEHLTHTCRGLFPGAGFSIYRQPLIGGRDIVTVDDYGNAVDVEGHFSSLLYFIAGTEH